MELLVDDRFYATTPAPELGEIMSFIRGPMAFNFNRNKLQPRDAADLGRAAQLVINEADYDQPGSDTEEFVEIYNAGPGSADLTDIAVIFAPDRHRYLTSNGPPFGRHPPRLLREFQKNH